MQSSIDTRGCRIVAAGLCQVVRVRVRVDEVKEAIDKSKCGKAGGPDDGITSEVYKALRNHIAPILLEIYNTVIRTKRVPKAWRKGMIVNLFKSGCRFDVMLLAIGGKLFNWILAKRITTYCVKEKVLNDKQDRFIYGRGITGHSKTVTEIISDITGRGEHAHVFYLDLSKAFDCISRKMIYQNLRQAGIPRHLVDIIADMHTKTKVRYRVDNSCTDEIETIQGVPQGDPLSPILFNLVINPMLMELDKHKICHRFMGEGTDSESLFMYADDFLCVCDSPEELQNAINICKKCIEYFNLRANVKKSAVMIFRSKKKIKETKRKLRSKKFMRTNREPMYEYKGTKKIQVVEKGKLVDKEVERWETHQKGETKELVFTWGSDGPNLTIECDYKYLRMILDSEMNWKEHFKKKNRKHMAASRRCASTFRDSEMGTDFKLQIMQSVIDPIDKHAIEAN